MRKGIFAVISVLILLLAFTSGKLMAAAASKPTPILTGALAKLDIKDAEIETARGKPKGTLTIAQHFALDPGWLDPSNTLRRSPSKPMTTWCMTPSSNPCPKGWQPIAWPSMPR